MMRRLHRWYASLFGYFWLPCPQCGKEVGCFAHPARSRTRTGCRLATFP